MSEITLTITLLSSGKKDLIEKCLDSMENLRKRVSCEMIIVDTKGDAETRELIEKYTDKIVDFEWINDFSKARNSGLEHAKGEWFLFIDDDEWFADTTEIEEFFLSKEYKQYTFADYLVRSFTSADYSTYNDGRVSRLYKLDPDTRFVSPIHEYIDSRGACKFLSNTVANHTGYFFENDQALFAKVCRNAPMLEEAIRQDPENPRWYAQQASELFSVKDYYHAEISARNGLEVIGNNISSDSNRFRGAFFVAILRIYLNTRKYDEAHEFIENIINNSEVYPKAQVIIIGEAAKVEHRRKNFNRAKAYAKEYFRLREVVKNDSEMFHVGTPFLEDTLEEESASKVRAVLESCYLKEDDVEGFVEIFNGQNLNDKKVYLDVDVIEDMLDAMERFEDGSIFIAPLNSLITRKGIIDLLIESLIKRKDSKNFHKLEKVFNNLEKSHPFLLYLKLIKEKNSYKAENIVRTMTIKEWEGTVNYIFKYKEDARNTDLINIITDKDKSLFYKYKKEEEKIKELACIENSDNYEMNYQSYKDLLWAYVNDCIDYSKMFYTQRCFEDDFPYLPSDVRASIYLRNAIELLDSESIKESAVPMGKAIELKPSFSDTSKLLIRLFKENKNQNSNSISQEIQTLSSEIKNKIKELLASGMRSEAKAIADQLKNISGEDIDLDALC